MYCIAIGLDSVGGVGLIGCASLRVAPWPAATRVIPSETRSKYIPVCSSPTSLLAEVSEGITRITASVWGFLEGFSRYVVADRLRVLRGFVHHPGLFLILLETAWRLFCRRLLHWRHPVVIAIWLIQALLVPDQ